MTKPSTGLKPHWISWYQSQEKFGEFELHSPWWITGSYGDDDGATICAAVLAKDEEHARAIVRASYDDKTKAEGLQWRFCEERPVDWSPFTSRFRRAYWMQWAQ